MPRSVHLPIDDAEHQRRCAVRRGPGAAGPQPASRWRVASQHPSGGARQDPAAAAADVAPRCAGSSTAPRPPSTSSCRRRRRSTAFGCSPRWRSRATAPAIVPATAVPRWLKGDFQRMQVPELPRRVVGWVQRRRPAPGIPTRVLLAVLRDVVACRAEAARRARRRRGIPPRPRRQSGARRYPCSPSSFATGSSALSASDVREFDGRQVVWVDVDAGSRVGALSSDVLGQIETAACTARAKGFPLIVIMRSSGADIVEGFAALHGWGLAAKALTPTVRASCR